MDTMPRVRPIAIGFPLREDGCSLGSLQLDGELRAEFSLSLREDPSWFAIRVRVRQVSTHLVTDEFVVNTSGPGYKGLDPSGFA